MFRIYMTMPLARHTNGGREEIVLILPHQTTKCRNFVKINSRVTKKIPCNTNKNFKSGNNIEGQKMIARDASN